MLNFEHVSGEAESLSFSLLGLGIGGAVAVFIKHGATSATVGLLALTGFGKFSLAFTREVLLLLKVLVAHTRNIQENGHFRLEISGLE
jgi:hypothetical protein